MDTDKPILLFSYGSNMSEKELNKYNKKVNDSTNQSNSTQTKHYQVLDVGYLSNHEFKYLPLYTKSKNPILKSAKATIIQLRPNPNTSKTPKVYGTIVQVSPKMYKLIVKKEGVNKKYYTPQTKIITSLISKTKYKTTVFVMTDKYKNKALEIIKTQPSPASIPSQYPSKRYENLLVKAATKYNLPSHYINNYLKQKENKD